jgi:hypothetical protein
MAAVSLKNFASLELEPTNAGSCQVVLELLQKRCIKQLRVCELTSERVFRALIKLNCTLNHEHTKLTSLKLRPFSITDEELPDMCMFFENGHASHLKILDVSFGKSLFWISKLCEALNHGNCTELTCLYLQYVKLKYEDASVLFDTLAKGLRKLTKLDVTECELTDRCIPMLV